MDAKLITIALMASVSMEFVRMVVTTVMIVHLVYVPMEPAQDVRVMKSVMEEYVDTDSAILASLTINVQMEFV